MTDKTKTNEKPEEKPEVEKLVKVRLLRNAAGPSGAWFAGDIVEFPEGEAKRLERESQVEILADNVKATDPIVAAGDGGEKK